MSDRDQFEAWWDGELDSSLSKRTELIWAKGLMYRAWQASREALKADRGYPEKLPCHVILEPGLRFGKGVDTRVMLGALQRRAERNAERDAMTPEQREEEDAAIRSILNLCPIDTTPNQYDALGKGER